MISDFVNWIERITTKQSVLLIVKQTTDLIVRTGLFIQETILGYAVVIQTKPVYQLLLFFCVVLPLLLIIVIFLVE